MAIAKKGSRLISVGNERYRWYVRCKPSYSQALAQSPLSIAVELAEQPAQVLHVAFDVPRPDAWLFTGEIPVTPKVVAAVIRRALREGWKPSIRGRTFTLTSTLRAR